VKTFPSCHVYPNEAIASMMSAEDLWYFPWLWPCNYRSWTVLRFCRVFWDL